MQLHAFVFPEVTVMPPSLAAVVALVLAVLLLMFSAFASGSEIALFSLSKSDVDVVNKVGS